MTNIISLVTSPGQVPLYDNCQFTDKEAGSEKLNVLLVGDGAQPSSVYLESVFQTVAMLGQLGARRFTGVVG